MRFSERTGFARVQNRVSEGLAARRAAGLDTIDWSESNPTRCGFEDETLLALLADARGTRYAPDALGLDSARAAVAAHFAERGRAIDPAQVVLTASSSEAYGWLFKLLCDPGDGVLVPRPSYPLLPYLARLEDVRLCDYPLLGAEGWRVDVAAIERALAEDARLRAIVLVHPNNPTGSLVGPADAAALAAVARAHGVALIVDEVFVDYPLRAVEPVSFAGRDDALTFVLGGLSKSALLPQLKLGWIACSGPGVDEALGRLELVADSYLSVATPVQLALPAILARTRAIQARLCTRLRENLATLDRALAAHPEAPVRRRPSDAGWYALVEVPRTRSDEAWALHLLEHGVHVHTGELFDFEERGVMVVSLLLEPDRFAAAVARALPLWLAG